MLSGFILKDSIYTPFDSPAPDFPATYTHLSDRISDPLYMKSAGEDTTLMEVEERVREQAEEIACLRAVMDAFSRIWTSGRDREFLKRLHHHNRDLP